MELLVTGTRSSRGYYRPTERALLAAAALSSLEVNLDEVNLDGREAGNSERHSKLPVAAWKRQGVNRGFEGLQMAPNSCLS